MPKGARVLTKRGEAVIRAFHATAPPGVDVDDEHAEHVGPRSRQGSVASDAAGDEAAAAAAASATASAEASKAEARSAACYEVASAAGVRYVKPRDVFALDDLDMAAAVAGGDGEPTAASAEEPSPKPRAAIKKKGASKKRKAPASAPAAAPPPPPPPSPPPEALPATPSPDFRPPPRSGVSLKGAALANERVYVFARLHQMVHARLADARALCEAEAARRAKLAAEPHDVAEAIKADDEGEPPLEADDLAGRSDSDDGDDDAEMRRLRGRGYAGFLEVVAMLLCGDVTKATFDDACRLLMGNDGYRVRALDKLARAAVDAMRALAADDTLKPLFDAPLDAFAPTEIGAAKKKALLTAAPALAGEDVYGVRVDRDADGRAVKLHVEFHGSMPEIPEDVDLMVPS